METNSEETEETKKRQRFWASFLTCKEKKLTALKTPTLHF